jgi:hypothetical protein
MNRRSFLSRSGRLLLTAGVAPMVFGANAVPEYNHGRSLTFSNDWIESTLIRAVKDVSVENEIVVNLSTSDLYYKAEGRPGTIPPWKSTILRHCLLEKGEMAALIHVRKRVNLGGVALDWEWYGHRNPEFPRGVPLYISSQDDIGDVEFDPLVTFASQTLVSPSPRRYRLKLNLWYTPEETDCGIHTGHKFLEVHTQLLGTGHMQKFRENNAATLYEDVFMPPGFTHEPFFMLQNDRNFTYPWHRYYADTDCIWMAIELHPL